MLIEWFVNEKRTSTKCLFPSRDIVIALKMIIMINNSEGNGAAESEHAAQSQLELEVPTNMYVHHLPSTLKYIINTYYEYDNTNII